MALNDLAVILLIVGVPVCGAAGAVTWSESWMRSWSQSEAVVQTCQVVKTFVKSSGTGGTPTGKWIIDITYEFVVGGKAYQGNRYSNVPPSSRATTRDEPGPSNKLQMICEQYIPGTTHPVHYNPAVPKYSMLVPVFGVSKWLWLVGLSLLIAAVVLFLRQRTG